MKMSEVKQILKSQKRGYRVSFEWKEGCIYRGDFFPDRQEPPIKTESEAWTLAHQFADKMVGKVVNVYVIDTEYRPVSSRHVFNKN